MSRMVPVKVNPKARQNRVEPDGAGGYIIWTTAAPEKGKANDAIIQSLAKHLGIAKSKISLVRGSTSRHKMVEIED